MKAKDAKKITDSQYMNDEELTKYLKERYKHIWNMIEKQAKIGCRKLVLGPIPKSAYNDIDFKSSMEFMGYKVKYSINNYDNETYVLSW